MAAFVFSVNIPYKRKNNGISKFGGPYAGSYYEVKRLLIPSLIVRLFYSLLGIVLIDFLYLFIFFFYFYKGIIFFFFKEFPSKLFLFTALYRRRSD